MRVISGTAKGRPLKAVPGTGTRPTTDKVKEAVFSMIGPYFEGGNVLDLFAGSGGLGIEALSRGMDKGIFIDLEPKSIEVIRANLKATKLENKAEVYRNEAGRALKLLAKRAYKFDVVFLDPPYRMKNADELMLAMQENDMLSEDAIVVVEYDAGHEYEEHFGHFDQTRKTTYGDTAISVYHYSPITESVEEDISHNETSQEIQVDE
ncbi:methyltransferase [Paenibacillus sp. J45TS6]|uniref:16S rRNA (guanine(966)-N(2))-methyltransferase RsmD n=1 Tax=unclassified Paenibacillus TaxID=185978 RepID=UPI001B1876DD|nr:16S rRNA (guanine(966)-N(2))-methyltransferase RsmD [Paenibacillus sp. J45TS6]GIP43677.1 methyltransferase [Paenibacillus sp. J45TS6]